MADKVSRAELAEAVRELRAEVASLRAERALHHCHGCGCAGWAYLYPYPLTPQPYVMPYQITCETPPNVITTGTSTVSGTSAQYFLS
jgi:hypothetical protein